MNIVAILSPKTLSPKTDYALELLTQGPSKSETDQPDTRACHIFAPAVWPLDPADTKSQAQRGTFLLVNDDRDMCYTRNDGCE